MRKFINHLVRLLLVLTLAGSLSGCGNEDLFTNVSEADANTMLGILLARGIPATKRPVKENNFAVTVPRDQFASAVDILKWYGIPKEQFTGVGELFQKTGLVSSPSEERIRFMYALSEDVSELLSNIDGVVTARVILVLPSNDPYSDTKYPSSASVFLKCRPGFDTSTKIPQIKQLVMNSVEGLSYEKVAVTIMRSDEVDYFFPVQQQAYYTKFLGIEMSKNTADRFFWLLGACGVLILLAVGAAVFAFLRPRKPVEPAEVAAAPGTAAST